MIKKLSNFELALVCLYGTLWGISEITLGFVLHNIHIPFTGLIQTFIAAFIVMILLRIIQKKRVVLYCGLIAGTLKFMSLSTVKFFPFLGIIMSSVLGQIVIWLLGISVYSVILASGVMCCWPFIQGFLFYLTAYSSQMLVIYQDFLSKIGLNISIKLFILLILAFHFFTGIISSILSIKVSNIILKKRSLDEPK